MFSRNDESKIFATEYQLRPYFMLELRFMTKVIGVVIISRDEVYRNVTHYIQNTNDAMITKEIGTQSINGVQIRAGALKIVNLCEENEYLATMDCKMWHGNDFCGELNITEPILPLREYTIMCEKPIPSKFITIQLPTPGDIKRSLTFEEISIIRGNFLDKKENKKPNSSIHGASGIVLNYFQHYNVS